MQSVLCLLITGIVYTLTGAAEAQTVLLTSSVEQDGRQVACPGEVITFTCTVAEAAGISWAAEPFMTNPIVFTFTDQSNDTQDRGVFHAVLKAVTMPDFFRANFISTLTVRASDSLNGTVVQCTIPHEGGEISNSSIFIASIPAPPQQLNYSIQEYGQNTFTATVLWENLLDDRVGRTNITIIITDFEPTLLLPDTATAVALTLSYNEVHTVSIAATNCAGTSDASQLKIYEVGCGDPMPPNSGTLECYNSTAEGSEVFYQCDAGLTPKEQMTAVCAPNGSWVPDPSELQCNQLPPVECELPSTLSGEGLNYSSITEGSLVIHHCEQGLLPTETMIAVCTADGVWDPDLAQLKCMAPGQPPETHDQKPTETTTSAHGLNPRAILVITATTSGIACFVVGGIVGALLHHCCTRKKPFGRQKYAYKKLHHSESNN